MSFSPERAAALQQPAVMLPFCLQWDLPGGPLRLSEAGFFSFEVDGQEVTFQERDETFGVLGAIGPIADGLMTEAPSTSFVIFPPTNAAMAALAAPGVQGSRVRIWEVVLDPITGQVVGEADEQFVGESDVLTNTVDENIRSLTITANSRMARFLRKKEGARLNNGFHQRCKPGELGLQYMQSVSRSIPWGSDTPTSALSAAQAAAYARLYGTTYFGA